mmetsp:Transcript_68701/g.199309  ORF Transcript_68701/g.199309 Transcript_68701/m.199309 type:complete len:203 (-) Transcript_68701:848-1456(-)
MSNSSSFKSLTSSSPPAAAAAISSGVAAAPIARRAFFSPAATPLRCVTCCLYSVEPRKLSCFKVSIFSNGVCTTLQNSVVAVMAMASEVSLGLPPRMVFSMSACFCSSSSPIAWIFSDTAVSAASPFFIAPSFERLASLRCLESCSYSSGSSSSEPASAGRPPICMALGSPMASSFSAFSGFRRLTAFLFAGLRNLAISSGV